MSRYFFSVVTSTGHIFRDEEGLTFSSREEALSYAVRMSNELVMDGQGYLEGAVVVENEQGSEVGRIRITK